MAIVPKILQVRITLNGIVPPIWRRFLVRSDVTLGKLYEIIQTVMGWEDYHLYCFKVGGLEYGDPDLVSEELEMHDVFSIKLQSALPFEGVEIVYVYDFGDNWEHTLLLERILDAEPGKRYPVCLDGARACPREDCGGIGGYEELLRVLSDPEDEEHEDMKQWAGENWNPERFDAGIVNIGLRRRVIVRKADGAAENTKRERDSKPGKRPTTYVCDMTHFLDENGMLPIEMPKEFYALMDYLAAIVRASSSHSGNTQLCSAIPCRRRPGRKPCGSNLMIVSQPDNVIHWLCTGCGEQGYISNWQGTIYDLSDAVESNPSPRLTVLVTAEEHRLLSGIITASQEEDAVVSGAMSTPDGILLTGGMEDFDLLLGSIAAEANHSGNAVKRRALDGVYGTIERVMEG